MTAPQRRKELVEQYKQAGAEAGVYRIVNTTNGRGLVGSTRNLAGVRNKLEFARTTDTVTALDHRLHADARRDGLDAFTFEVLDALERDAGVSDEQFAADLATLESMWRERQELRY